MNPDVDQTEEGEEEDVDTATDEVLNAVRTGPRNNPLENIPVEEILEWVDSDMNEPIEEELTDEAIVQSVVNPQPINLEEPDSDDGDERKRVSWGKASDALNKFITFVETSSLYNCAEIIDLHVVRNNFLKKRGDSRKQKDIRVFLISLDV